ncbi:MULTISPECIES: DUF6918 family protein [unclassified Luteococcus]|uniref:DUF6918 family protein n=1 Tax=unclassified Luteococcus TaxID=2639923 RepID=UPI00313BB4B3
MSFSESLLNPTNRPQVVQAISTVIDQEVAGKGGLGGMALKGAYASAKKMKDGIVVKGTNAMLPDIAAALEPYWNAKGDQDFGAYLASRSGEVADDLLTVADAKAASPDNAAIAKLYKPIRGKAKGYVEEALPRLAAALTPFVS